MSTSASKLSGPWSNWIMAAAYVGLVFSFQSSYGILSRAMGRALHLSVADISLVGSVYTWCFAATQIMAGPLLDRVGVQRILPAACTIFVLGIFCFGFADSVHGLLAAQMLLAVGASFGFIGAGFVGGLWFKPERYGAMFAWVQFTGSIIACVAQAVAALLIDVYPWNWIINAIGLSGLGLMIVLLLFLADPPTAQMRGWPKHPLEFTRCVFNDLAGALRKPGMPSVIAAGAVSFGVMLAIGVVWGPQLGTSLGFSEHGSALSAASWFGLAIGAPAFARLSAKRLSLPQAFLLGYLAQLLLLAWMTLSPARTLHGFGLQMLGFGVASGSSMLPFTMAAKLAGSRYAGTSAALVNGAQFVAGGLLMSLPGRLLGSQHAPEIRHVLLVLPAALLSLLPCFVSIRKQSMTTCE